MKRTLCMAGLLLAAASCNSADAPLAVESTTHKQIMLNRLTVDQILNTLTGTPEALHALANSPLSSASFGPNTILGPLLVDVKAHAFMHHLVACALTPEQSVSWTSPSNQQHVWHGAYGLCPSWGSAAPSIACQEIVSACLLSKNNAFGRRVTVSMRGDDLGDQPLPLEATVQARTHVEYSTDLSGARVYSFNECMFLDAGADRVCGWPEHLAMVGQCDPPHPGDPDPEPVIVGAGAPNPITCEPTVLGAATGDLVMRVCEGTSGCNSNEALAQTEGACQSTAPALSFTCPQSGIFTVMLAPQQSTDLNADGWADASANATLPVSEAQLFKVREGAFYGNLFDSTLLSTDVRVYLGSNGRPVRQVTGTGNIVVFEDLWSCHDPDWDTPVAYMHERLCATDEQVSLCAAKHVGSCEEPLINNETQNSRCTWGHGDFGYRNCMDGKGVFREHTITAVLKKACDMLPPNLHDLCNRVLPV